MIRPVLTELALFLAPFVLYAVFLAATRAGVQGVVIVRTAPGSSAQRAGLRGMDQRSGKPGDIIVAINDKPVRGLADLIQELERVGVGKRVTLTVQRDGREMPIEVDVMDIGRRS